MSKKTLSIGLVVLMIGLIIGTVTAYHGLPKNTEQTINSSVYENASQEANNSTYENISSEYENVSTTNGNTYKNCKHTRHMHHQSTEYRKGTPQLMRLGNNGQYLEEVEINKEQVEDYLSNITIEKITTPKGVTIQKLILDEECIGKIIGDYNISSLEIYKAYKTKDGIKVFLSYDGKIVGFFLMKWPLFPFLLSTSQTTINETFQHFYNVVEKSQTTITKVN